ncbi:nitrite reductase small subunit NirD [Saccharospirillum salsuginis]|uniref:Naphthalene 1,2-dioxygenase n=1 Tax=Saccharospirillum salsuginis TaxID=418750 RepID=A0A918K2Q8_9GAMM|nr:nitrite reductase small subunit NirD [Saccharospirillum salsuginis]GGX45143.1 naphthalene 1,2-dioxygenase [Saccharospirillum salsuginis]
MSWETVCKKNDIQEDFPYSAKVDGKEIGVYCIDGEYYALEDVCPHAYALLSQGFVEDGQVECPLHEAVFDIKTGQCLREPADRDLHVYPVRIIEDDVQLQLNSEA